MKRSLDPLVGAVAAALTAFGYSCGSANVACTTTACSSGSATYQVCSDVDGSLEYKFSGSSCNCSAADANSCMDCEAKVETYCTDRGVRPGGAINHPDGGGGDAATSGSGGCTATFSGAVTGTYAPCEVTVTYDAAADQWSASTSGNPIPGTDDSWVGFNFNVAGMPTVGTFDQTTAVGASNTLDGPDSAGSPMWEAAATTLGTPVAIGTATLTLTSLGPAMDAGNGNLVYAAPHGSWQGHLLDQNAATAQPPVDETVTF